MTMSLAERADSTLLDAPSVCGSGAAVCGSGSVSSPSRVISHNPTRARDDVRTNVVRNERRYIYLRYVT